MHPVRLPSLLVLSLLLFACKQEAQAPAPAPVAAPAPSWASEREALTQQVAALDAEADRVTRELVKVKVERDQLRRELHELFKRSGCAPAATR